MSRLSRCFPAAGTPFKEQWGCSLQQTGKTTNESETKTSTILLDTLPTVYES